MTPLEGQLHRIIFGCWEVPAREGQCLLRALLHSRASRAGTLRQRLALCQVAYPTSQGWQALDIRHSFDTAITPAFALALVQDLVSIGTLSGAQARTIEACVLERVDDMGKWKIVA